MVLAVCPEDGEGLPVDVRVPEASGFDDGPGVDETWHETPSLSNSCLPL